MMKRIVSLLLCLLICLSTLSLWGCLEENNKANNKVNDKTNNSDITDQAEDKAPNAVISIDGLKDGNAFVPYTEKALDYITAEPGANVADYYKAMDNPNRPITIEWDFNLQETADSYWIRYSPYEDYTDAIIVSVSGDTSSYNLYNLYKNTTYYCSVIYIKGGETITKEITFKTTDLGPRVMSVEGIYNVRDIGGYATESGKTTVQGLIYRGGSLRPYNNYNSFLTEKGAALMSDLLGIKTEIDVRGEGAEAGDIKESLIPGANLEYHKLIAYHEIFDVPENVRRIFSLLADKNNYPIYFHCSGGADRTGTLGFLINALLGVSYEDLIHDYEFTTFSIYKERNSADGTKYGTNFHKFLDELNTYSGNTLSQKVESYLLSIGVTAGEIQNIKDIMLGEVDLGGFVPQN